MTAQAPVLVLVGGPAAAGKTTLARALADRMGLVHICRDSVKSAIAVSDAVVAGGRPRFDPTKAQMGGEYGQRAFPATYAAVTALLDGGAAVVMDQAWRPGRAEQELAPLLERSRSVLLLAVVEPDTAASRVRSRGHRHGLAPLHEILATTTGAHDAYVAFDVGVPRLTVDSTDGYDPSLAEVEDWIWSQV